MASTALEIINEGMLDDGLFVIDSDKNAERILKLIQEETAEVQRYVNVCDTFISEYEYKKNQAKEELEKKLFWYKQQLQNYFERVDKKATKTQITYKLPSGTLKLKFGTTEFVRDNEALVKWLKESGRNELVKLKEEPNWAELKKEVWDIKAGQAITKDGEIIDGVVAKERPDTFEIEF